MAPLGKTEAVSNVNGKKPGQGNKVRAALTGHCSEHPGEEMN